MTFSNAGHNFPVVIRRECEPMFLERGGTVLGIVDGAVYEEERLRLDAGDLVVLYTDGISEAMNRDGELSGDARLYELVRGLPQHLSAREVTDHVLEALRAFLDGEEPRDDMTLMALRVLEPGPVPRPREPEGAGAEAQPISV